MPPSPDMSASTIRAAVPGSMMGLTASSAAIDYKVRVSVEPWQWGSSLSMMRAARLSDSGAGESCRGPLMQGELCRALRKELTTVNAILEYERTAAPAQKIARPD